MKAVLRILVVVVLLCAVGGCGVAVRTEPTARPQEEQPAARQETGPDANRDVQQRR